MSPLQALEKIHETFQSDIDAENNRIRQLEALAQELAEYHYYHSDTIHARMQVCVCVCVCMRPSMCEAVFVMILLLLPAHRV